MTGSQQSKGSPFFAQWLIFVIAASLLGGLLAWHAYRSHAETDALERERLSIRAKIVDESVARQMDAIGRMLSGLRSELGRWGELEDGMMRASRRMAAMADVMQGVHFVAALDARGRIVASSGQGVTGQDFSYRDYFQAPLRNPDPDITFVSPPYKNVSGVLTISLSRALVAPDGRFAGVVMASLEPKEFRVLANSVRHAPDMHAFLLHGDGAAFMAVPEREGLIGTNAAVEPGSFFNRHIESGQITSVVSARVSASGEQRMTVLRTSRPATLRVSKPMVVAVSRDLSAVFANWRREAWLQGGLFGLLLLVSGAGLFVYQRRQRSFDRIVADYQTGQQKIAERLKLASEAAGIGVWEYDLVSAKLFWDDSMFAIYGVKSDTFSGNYEEWRSSVLPEDMAAVDAAVGPSLEEGKPYDVSFRIRREDGQIRNIRALAQVYFDESGKAVRMVGINEDITERRQAELAMIESETRFREIFNAVSDAIFIHDAETGCILDVNRRMLEMYGVTREEALACAPDDLSAGVPPYSSAEAIEKIRLVRGEGPQIFDWLARAHDGHHFWVEVSLRLATIGNRQLILATVRDISERKIAEEEIHNLAFYDALTRLPNRRLLNDRLRQIMAASKRSGLYCALMFLDLDNFKPLNDMHGHDVGDLLLAEVAQRIAGCVREADTVARFGGDEFVVMLGELDADKDESAKQAGAVAEKIRAILAEPYRLSLKRNGAAEVSLEHHCAASIGVVLFANHEASPEDLLKWADIAMYRAKEGGRNRVHFYAA